eukprot:1079184-Pelagomonas_calceolata.AAC.1
MLLLSRAYLMLWPCVFTELDFYEMHMALVHMDFMWMPNAASFGCPRGGPAQSVLRMNRRDTVRSRLGITGGDQNGIRST